MITELTRFGKFPFLIIVPATTIGNWIREFKKWAPSVVAIDICGTKKSRDLIRDNLVFSNSHSLKCHVVIASYEHTLMDKSFFKKFSWQVLVCDEGHRLKNDESKTFSIVNSINAEHRVLLSGTPLQNNLRELFNLMSFIAPDKFSDGSEWETKYNDLSEDKVLELHQELKPYFLRRTKKLVLTDLPPLVFFVYVG